MTKRVKRAYRYRFYPSPGQTVELLRTFGCVRKVWNLALDARTQAWYQRQERVSYVQSSAMLTGWKEADNLAYLNEVSSVPLQQALRHLQAAFAAFFDKRAKYPRFKSRRRSRQSAEYTRSAFRWRDGTLACSACGRLASKMPLDVREWQCASCGARHDRDVTAAVNIRAAGLAVLACGGSVRPKREESRAGGSRRNRNPGR